MDNDILYESFTDNGLYKIMKSEKLIVNSERFAEIDYCKDVEV